VSYEEAGSVYRQTVLQAFREVADSLYAIRHDAQTLQTRAEAVNSAEGAHRIASQRYQAGGIGQLALLDSERKQLQTVLDHANVSASRYADSATPIQAVGGEWWNDNPAQPKTAPTDKIR
jgi:outer membrane protein TolC